MKKNVELFFHFLGNAYLCPPKRVYYVRTPCE